MGCRVRHNIFSVCTGGLTLMPWGRCECLVWNFKRCHTPAASFVNRAVRVWSRACCNCSRRKVTRQWRHNCRVYTFVCLLFKYLVALLSDSFTVMSDFHRRLQCVMQEPCAFKFLSQRISASSVWHCDMHRTVGSLPSGAHWDKYCLHKWHCVHTARCYVAL